MGIKDLNTFLKVKVPEGIKERSLEYFKGKKIAIDTSIYLYKFLYKNDRFLEGFFQQIYRLVYSGITPIYIFDGAPPKQKRDVIIHRREKKEDLKIRSIELSKKLTTVDDPSIIKDIKHKIAKINKKVINVTKDHIQQLKFMLDLMNIQYIHPKGEADSYCSALYKDDKVDLCLSDDMDLLVSGTRMLLRNFNVSSNMVTEYNLNKILSGLELTDNQWIDFCIMCGCDYTSRIPGIGPKNAYKLIKEHGNIETILEHIKDDVNYIIPKNFNFIKARQLFGNCAYYEQDNKYDIKIKKLVTNQIFRIRDYVTEKTQLTKKQINNRLCRIYSVNLPKLICA